MCNYSNNQCLVFSHDENSAGYSACDTKYGDISDNNGVEFGSYDDGDGISIYRYVRTNSKWYNSLRSASAVTIENKIKPTNMDCYFYGFYNGQIINGLEKIDISECNSFKKAFAVGSNVQGLENLSSWDVSKVTDMSYMFSETSVSTLSGITNWDVSNVEDMSYMFNGATSLTQLDLSNWDTSKVKTMASMFSACSNITKLNWGGPMACEMNSCLSTKSMFDRCRKLTLYTAGYNSFSNTGNIQNMSNMFASLNTGSGVLSNQYCSSDNFSFPESFDTSGCKNMSGMFQGTRGILRLYLYHFDTSNVDDMTYMFYNSKELHSVGYGTNFVKKQGLRYTGMVSGTVSAKIPTGW